MNWKTEKRKVSDLIPYSKNPRTLSQKQHKELLKSFKKFNLVEIPAINIDNVILAGHQRLKIMSELGMGEQEIDVRIPDRLLNESEVQEYNIRSNKNSGEWDMDILANNFEIDDLLEWGFEENEFGISPEKEMDNIKSEGLNTKNSVIIKMFLISPDDWVVNKNEICNFLIERKVNFEIIE